MLPYIEKVISLLSIGFITVVLNLIEVVIIAKEGHGRSLLETTPLSLGFADLFVGIAVILSGTCYLLPSSVSPDPDQILYASLVIIFPMSFWASFQHILLTAAETFSAVYFPIPHPLFILKKRNSIIEVSILWLSSVLTCPLHYFQTEAFMYLSLAAAYIGIEIMIIIY